MVIVSVDYSGLSHGGASLGPVSSKLLRATSGFPEVPGSPVGRAVPDNPTHRGNGHVASAMNMWVSVMIVLKSH